MIRAGDLNRRITILAQEIDRDAMGAAVERYYPVHTNIPAQVKPYSGREKFHAESDREIAYRQCKFVIRFISGLTDKHRIDYDGSRWDIVWRAEIGLREGIEILAQVAQ